MRGTAVKLVAFLLASLLSLAWLANQIGQVRGPAGAFHKTYAVRAAFTDATGLVKGDEVRLAGVRIGKVSGMEVDAGKAAVTMKIDSAYKLPADSRFELHWKNLLGQRYVQAAPPEGASLAGPVLKDGAKLGADRTAQAADLVDTLSVRADVIGKSITEYATLIEGIAGHDAEVRQLLDSLAGTSQTLAQRANDLGDAAGKTGEFTATLAKVLAANEGSLDGVFTDTKTILDRIAADKGVLAKALQTLPWTTSAMMRATSHGDWINAYVRGAGVVDAYFAEPRVGPDYNNIGPDDPKGGDPMLGTPRAPLPPAPTADGGLIAVNPPAGKQPASQSQGVGTLLTPLLGPGS